MESASANKLVEEYLPLVTMVVGRERRKLGMDPTATDEMRSFAMEGLVAAINKYDASRGVPFKSYLEMRMKWAIYDGLQQYGWFPRRLRRQINFYRRATEMLAHQSETPPPKDKVEAVHRLSDRLKELATAYVTTYSVEDRNEPASVPPEAEESLEHKRFSLRMRTYVETLPAKERHVVRRYFFEDARLTEIAAELKVTTSWVSRLLSAALKKLHGLLEEETEMVDAIRHPSL